MEQVTETVEKNLPKYTGTIYLTNSEKVGFTRRDLALCFYPSKVVQKADIIYQTLLIDGRPIPIVNERLINHIFDMIEKRFIYDKTVKKIEKQGFRWSKILQRLLIDYNLSWFYVSPEKSNKVVNTLKITTKTPIFAEHKKIVEGIYNTIHTNAPKLTLEKGGCTVEGVCPLDS